jgi:flagellar hook-associated protein 2
LAGLNVGLISGMNLADTVDQLIAVERNPQTLLKRKLADTQADVTAYRSVNTKFDALRTAAEALTRIGTWGAVQAASSAGHVTAASTTGATAGSVTFTVRSLATHHTAVSGENWAAATDPFDTTSPLVLTRADGSTQTITLDSGATLADAVSAINSQAPDVSATALDTGTGFRLQVAAKTAGAAHTFSLGGDFTTLVTGTNATLHLGPDDGGFDVTSPTNTFSGLLTGTTLTVTATGGPVTVTVASDPAAVAAAVGKLVSAANDVLSEIKRTTDSALGSTAALKGDSTLRGLSGKVLDAVSAAIGGTDSAAQVGIQLTRDGLLTFDQTKFTAALEADPATARRLVDGTGIGATAVPGVAQRLLAVVKEATDTTTGALTRRTETQDAAVRDLQDRIEAWDRRLELRRATLTAQFTAMETALSSLQNQSAWLSSQITGLPTWSTSS